MIKHRTSKRLSEKSTYAWKLEGTFLVPKRSEKSMLMTRKLQLIMRGLLIQAPPWSWTIWAGAPVPACAVAFPGWHKGHEKCLTLLVEAEVLQGLVEAPGSGDGADVAVGADGAQPRRAGPVPHRGQAPALCQARGSSHGWGQTQPQHLGYGPANESLKHQ